MIKVRVCITGEDDSVKRTGSVQKAGGLG
jgi:hypothetical protein